MKAIELIGDIDDQHRLHAQVPKEQPAGQVRLIVLLPGEDEPAACGHTGLPPNGRRNCATLSRTFTRWTMVSP